MLVNCILLHDFKWLVLLLGPTFLIGDYLCALANNNYKVSQDPLYNDYGKVKDRFILSLFMYVVICFSHWQQQKDMSIIIIKKQMVQR